MKVSIVITSHNYGLYIERCVRSCLNQNYPADQFEIIVVDDASTDNTASIVKKFETYPNFRFLVNEKNGGVATASNRGIRESLGQFVVRVDADDYVNSHLVSFLSMYLEANNTLLGVGCDYVLVDDNEEIIRRVYVADEPISCGVMYRKDILIKHGLYNDDFRHCEEKELRARMGDEYKVDYLKIPLYRYRMHKNNKTKQVKEIEKFTNKIKNLHHKQS